MLSIHKKGNQYALYDSVLNCELVRGSKKSITAMKNRLDIEPSICKADRDYQDGE